MTNNEKEMIACIVKIGFRLCGLACLYYGVQGLLGTEGVLVMWGLILLTPTRWLK